MPREDKVSVCQRLLSRTFSYTGKSRDEEVELEMTTAIKKVAQSSTLSVGRFRTNKIYQIFLICLCSCSGGCLSQAIVIASRLDRPKATEYQRPQISCDSKTKKMSRKNLERILKKIKEGDFEASEIGTVCPNEDKIVIFNFRVSKRQYKEIVNRSGCPHVVTRLETTASSRKMANILMISGLAVGAAAVAGAVFGGNNGAVAAGIVLAPVGMLGGSIVKKNNQFSLEDSMLHFKLCLDSKKEFTEE